MDSLPKHSPGNLQPSIYAAVTITLVLAVIAVALRFVARRLTRSPLRLDDWLTIVALVCYPSLFIHRNFSNIDDNELLKLTAIGFDTNIYLLTKNGIGLHIETVGRDLALAYHDFFLGLWIAELFYTFALTASKLTFLAFYWRIFRVSSITLPIKITGAVIVCWAIVRIIVTICHCIPVQGYWDKSVAASCNVDDRKFFIGSVLPHLLMDLVILALPVPYIKSLQISLYQKFCVSAMFLFGGFLCFASIIQIVVCFKLDTTSADVTWAFTPIAIWASVEVNLAVMAVCLPSLRPVYRLAIGSTQNSIQMSHQGTHNTGTWNSKSRFQVLSTLKPNYSESTKQLAVIDGEGNRSIGEDFVDTPGQRSITTCEVENMAHGRMHRAKDVITVKEEVNVRISTSDRVVGV